MTPLLPVKVECYEDQSVGIQIDSVDYRRGSIIHGDDRVEINDPFITKEHAFWILRAAVLLLNHFGEFE
jgi:hypothetical protein